MLEIDREIFEQNKLRCGWDKTRDELVSFFYEEHEEYLDALTAVYIGAGPQILAQEMADKYIVYIQAESKGWETEDMVDSMFETLELADELGIDIDQAIRQKNLRNAIKYPVDLLRDPHKTSSEMIKDCKTLYSAMGGDIAFYEYYNYVLDHEKQSKRVEREGCREKAMNSITT